MQVHILLLLCVCCIRGVTSFPDGQVDESCQNLTPNHVNFESQMTSCPYIVSVDSTTFTPGQTITVTLQAAENGSEFQGFMLQAREVDGKTAVGRFTSINTNPVQVQSRALNCFDIENSTLSQASAEKKSQFEATWEAPANSSLGDIQFFVTFVQNYAAFWTMVNSSTIWSIKNQSPSSTSPSSSTSTTTRPPDRPRPTTRPPAGSQLTSFLPNCCNKNIHLRILPLGLILLVLILTNLYF